METTVDFICDVTGCAVPTKVQKIPPKAYFITAISYFTDIQNGKTPMPKEIETKAHLDDCIKNTKIKYLMYEKAAQDLIQQGIKPVVDEDDKFLIEGWNTPVTVVDSEEDE
jgi:hypothetical protein